MCGGTGGKGERGRGGRGVEEGRREDSGDKSGRGTDMKTRKDPRGFRESPLVLSDVSVFP